MTRSIAIHAIPQTTRLNNHSVREDSTHVLPQTQSYSVERLLRADEHWATNWNQRGSKAVGSDVTAKTDEHVI